MGHAESVPEPNFCNMKILFLSGLYSKGSETYYTSKLRRGSLANPSNVYQWGIVNGLLSNRIDVEICSFPFLPTYPSGYHETRSREDNIEIEGKSIGKAYSYNTVAGCKEFSIINKARKVVHKWAQQISKEEIGIILIYSLYGPFLKVAVETAKQQSNIKVCPIVTDLFISSLSVLKPYPFLKKIQGFFEYRMIKKGLKNADTFVLLAKGMEKYIPQAHNNHVIIEGISVGNYPKPANKVGSSEKKLLYTGSLGVHTNIKELVDAFVLTSDPNFRLVICGSGDFEEYIRKKAKEDMRIIFKGNISREEAVQLQKEATLLINPRLPSIPDTPYSFPSKTIEYLVSGTPMIGYKLAGIPEEYYQYFYIPNDESIESLSVLISDTLNKSQDELDARGAVSWRFIVESKNAYIQVKKMIEYFEKRFSTTSVQ